MNDVNNEDEAERETTDAADHLQTVDDGAGCVEIWERLSAERDEE